MQELLESLQGIEKYSYNNEAILCPIPLLQLNQREKKRLKIVILNNKGINELPIPSISILYLTTASVNMNEVSMLKNGQIKTHTCTSMQTVLNERLVSHIFCWQHFYSNSIKNKLYITQTISRTQPVLQGTTQGQVLMVMLIFNNPRKEISAKLLMWMQLQMYLLSLETPEVKKNVAPP